MTLAHSAAVAPPTGCSPAAWQVVTQFFCLFTGRYSTLASVSALRVSVDFCSGRALLPAAAGPNLQAVGRWAPGAGGGRRLR